jgi:hypothetical protein
MNFTSAEIAGYGTLFTALGAVVSRLTSAHIQGRKLDRDAYRRAYLDKTAEHRECIDEVKSLREEVVRNRDEIADVRVALARSEERHERAEEERERDREECERALEELRRYVDQRIVKEEP